MLFVMNDDELIFLMGLNVERTQNEKDRIMEEFYKFDCFIQSKLKENSKHQIFDSEEEFEEAIKKDFNPYNTFALKI